MQAADSCRLRWWARDRSSHDGTGSAAQAPRLQDIPITFYGAHMRVLTWVAAVALALAAGCDRNTTTTPSPKTDVSPKADSTSTAPSAAAGSSTTSSSRGTPTTSEKREGSNPTQGQVDPKHADQ